MDRNNDNKLSGTGIIIVSNVEGARDIVEKDALEFTVKYFDNREQQEKIVTRKVYMDVDPVNQDEDD